VLVVRAVLAAGLGGAMAVLGFAAPALAHVGISPQQAAAGGFVRLSLQVPTESDTLSTTRVQVFLDTSHPIAQVLTEPIPGWTVSTTTTKLATPIKTDDGATVTAAVSQVAWTATSPATAIKPGEFQEFTLSLGTLPGDVSQLEFKTLQTYSDGSVVRWIDDTPAGGPEPEHPAPVLQIGASTGGAATADPAGTSAGGQAAAAQGTASGGGGSSSGALALGAVGAVLGLVGAVLGALAFARTRRAAGQPT
jgi:uncharacterized protein YcnI